MQSSCKALLCSCCYGMFCFRIRFVRGILQLAEGSVRFLIKVRQISPHKKSITVGFLIALWGLICCYKFLLRNAEMREGIGIADRVVSTRVRQFSFFKEKFSNRMPASAGTSSPLKSSRRERRMSSKLGLMNIFQFPHC